MKKTTNPQRKVSSLTTHYSQLKMLMMKKNHDTNNQFPEKSLTTHFPPSVRKASIAMVGLPLLPQALSAYHDQLRAPCGSQ